MPSIPLASPEAFAIVPPSTCEDDAPEVLPATVDRHLCRSTRLVLAGVAVCLGTVLGVACWLRPDPRGMGTHQQLGLPPCTFYLYTDVPCPSCGMTTSFTA